MEINPSKPVWYDRGFTARIISINFEARWPIIAAVKVGKRESIRKFDIEGNSASGGGKLVNV